ncbi:cdc42 effector protein 1 [Protobothrops mucrosquamatus]|uniref:cdc42 effector protein 1 n=1 Tax=Protobothrops mucrosquamatus TaxID=103944 RepID=UPI000775D7C0|nr:cdc42 effector protein 1 [Protobothrops mucrosquamatus]
MSLGKLPVIGWVSGSHSKRRFKTELTPEMISPPLGDFRHTMHVGRGGDAFGDTSFLRNHGGEEVKPHNFFARTLWHVRRSPLRNRGSRNKDQGSSAPPAISPIIKNAVSLPQLNQTHYETDDLGIAFAFKKPPTSFSDYGLESGFCTIPRVPRSEKAPESSRPAESALQRSDSLLSFRLDLGPSLMSELLHVISFSGSNSFDCREKTDCEESKPPSSSEPHSSLHVKSSWSEGSLLGKSESHHGNGEESQNSSSLLDYSEPGSPLGHLVYTNGDSHSIELSEEGSPCLRSRSSSSELGAVPKETYWQKGHHSDCNMEAREFNHAAHVLACHYEAGSTYCSPSPQDHPKRQTARESPITNSWHLKVGAPEQQEYSTGWQQIREVEEEEEEEEDHDKFDSDEETIVTERYNDSFEYVDEEDEDEVKV